ncbi:VHS-domain-containing protein [Violaceomyces palustris]|uniref:VHS-domain-containing protein n=1 Tax=Violaceomyces palustris TaxID=1673888 RepID=A0ACD0NUA3_9BASI|nr:VHS-domain-containing protein [Violaceomyces palustris]
MYNHHQQRYSSSSSGSSRAAGAIGALADWAVKNLDPEVQATPIQAYVERCCDPSLSQPNLALDLELADYINSKKANTPREAAIETVRKINSRNPHVGMLALSLLDILVKNCGYPFHLQIATKEFLNELVKRFPERPPAFPSPVQSKILELVHEWKQTLCVTSKHKEDLVHIRDMHRLLSYKGYRFPNIDMRAAAVMNPESTLKSPEELEEEDRAAQAAKLQELIRRGTPRDLAQAQELMKIMSGAEPENKPDYSSQTQKELDKVQSRAILLNDMLNNAKEGEKFVKGDAYDQISSHLRSVQPRIQRWISDAEEDEGVNQQMDRLLLMNDLINQVCERYVAFSKGDFTAKAIIDPSIDPSRGGVDAVPTAKITDLISFDDEPEQGDKGKGSSSELDDFASLTFDDSTLKNSSGSNSNNLLQGIHSSTGDQTKPKENLTGPGGLPADLFSTSPPSSTQPNQSGGLGSWGVLQLPTATSSSSPTTIPSNVLTPTPARSGPSTGQAGGFTETKTNGSSSTPSQKVSNDPFADLDAMFK